jgi:hypothetical protein
MVLCAGHSPVEIETDPLIVATIRRLTIRWPNMATPNCRSTMWVRESHEGTAHSNRRFPQGFGFRGPSNDRGYGQNRRICIGSPMAEPAPGLPHCLLGYN